jgi:hypothetical protein
LKYIQCRSYICIYIGPNLITFKVDAEKYKMPAESIIYDHLADIKVKDKYFVEVPSDNCCIYLLKI